MNFDDTAAKEAPDEPSLVGMVSQQREQMTRMVKQIEELQVKVNELLARTEPAALDSALGRYVSRVRR